MVATFVVATILAGATAFAGTTTFAGTAAFAGTGIRRGVETPATRFKACARVSDRAEANWASARV
jgi:hypothetical protein